MSSQPDLPFSNERCGSIVNGDFPFIQILSTEAGFVLQAFLSGGKCHPTQWPSLILHSHSQVEGGKHLLFSLLLLLKQSVATQSQELSGMGSLLLLFWDSSFHNTHVLSPIEARTNTPVKTIQWLILNKKPVYMNNHYWICLNMKRLLTIATYC